MAETLTSVLTKPGELEAFRFLVNEDTGDPSSAVCQVFVPWLAIDDEFGDLVPDFDPGARELSLAINTGPDSQSFHLPISDDGPQITNGRIEAFGLRKVRIGLWALAPSLNLPGVLHAYIVLHGVPDPAPWETSIILCDAQGREVRNAH